MIIFVLILIAIVFFLGWNLVEKPRLHWMIALVTTALFVLVTFFAVANFSDHYGMHTERLTRTQRIYSPRPKILMYNPMGRRQASQIVIYHNRANKVVHTKPDVSVTNRIVRSSHVKTPYVKMIDSKWSYRTSWTRFWFDLAEKPSIKKTHYIFYVPKSWYVLSAKQARAMRQIMKNKGRQMKAKMQSPAAKQVIRQKAASYVQSQLARAIRKDPQMSKSRRTRIAKKAMNRFKSRYRSAAEAKLLPEALKTVETIR